MDAPIDCIWLPSADSILTVKTNELLLKVIDFLLLLLKVLIFVILALFHLLY